MRDVSESERIERELSLSEERFFTIFRSSPVAMAIGTATDGRLIDVNDRYLELLGCRRDELIGRTTAERGDWVDPEQRMELVRRIESGEKIRNVEARFRRKSGEIGIALFSMEIVRLRGESVLVTMRVDITERKRTEEALRQALEERESLVRDLHDGIVQQIYAVGLRLEQTQRNVVEGAAGSAADGLAQAITDLNTVIRTLRGHILGSSPQVLDGHQLRAELQELARSVDGAQRLRFRLEIDQEAALRLTPKSANQVLNIVREAMSNSLRHSCGQHGLVSLQSNRDGVRVVVEDDGHGFDRDRAGSDGQGLRNMAARASQLNAHLKIHSSPGGGTRITLEIPALNGEVVR
jgi:PAS domain S-box-containing protein